MYAIFYDYTDESGYEWHNCQETFYGEWSELQEHINNLREQGCYNIDAEYIGDPYEYNEEECFDD